MKTPTKRQFRVLTIAGFLIGLLGTLMEYYRFPKPLPEESTALDWFGYGTVLSNEVYGLAMRVNVVLYYTSACAFLLFKPWSRWLLLASMILTALMSATGGLQVFRGITLFTTDVGSMFFMFPFVLSFFEPCSQYFAPHAKPSSD